MEDIQVIDVKPGNIETETLFCIKDVLSPGFECKKQWFEERYEEGLRMKILKGPDGKMIVLCCVCVFSISITVILHLTVGFLH